MTFPIMTLLTKLKAKTVSVIRSFIIFVPCLEMNSINLLFLFVYNCGNRTQLKDSEQKKLRIEHNYSSATEFTEN